MNRPLCFVLMPFGKKPDGSGGTVDFDAVYREVIAPAIEAAGMQPLRADEEMGGGMIHKPMFERLILCEYAVADLTTANANVFYELGIRHAARPWSTVLTYVDRARLPFDVAPLRAIPYRLAAGGTPAEADEVRAVIAQRLDRARDAVPDSPIYELVEDFPNVDHTKTDVFRDRVRYTTSVKAKLAVARDAQNIQAIREIESELEPVEDEEAGIVVDLLLTYRAVRGWKEMISLTARMSPPLAETVMVQEQLAFALNRDGQGEQAERVLLELLEKRGQSSETYGILGRVYKDRWDEALKGGRTAMARGLLRKAIDAYLKGFEADWRDAYPGINAVTLMEVADPPDPRRERLIPVVSYAVERRIETGQPDYWDYATLLELAVLGNREQEAFDALGDALANVRESWEPETTLRNLRLIRERREQRGEAVPWAIEIERELEARAATSGPDPGAPRRRSGTGG
jgi:tetratricopeptide (TPR) repeat protein